ncbi:cysteine protease ATG4C isoform X3 [Betta splendens]|uniref:Cysteine protease n=1 Tax=Betta splendens TaxID=158456 RepID=A0A9W2XRH0_BETSP|nr:cysteine protease ATG4C isoform X3 [Betta splendens]
MLNGGWCRLGWALTTKTSFSRNSPVLLLGKCYHFKAEDDSSPTEACYEAPDDDFIMGNVEAFRKDFASRLWLTYREEFPPLPGSSLTSDCGWGCMLRAGQMMLAQALILHFMGRDWTWSEALTLQPLDTETRTTTAAKRLVASLEASLQVSPRQSDPQSSTTPQTRAAGSAQEADAHLKEMYHRTLVSWFGDTSSAQLGLHRLVHLGLTMGKQAGDWYGPAVVAHILKKAVEEAMDPALAGITAYVSQDCTVYSADVLDSHRASTAGHVSTERSDAPPLTQNNQQASASTLQDSRAVIILVPVRLGGEKTNPEYFEFAKVRNSILSLEYCIGIIGGKPKQACYFVGFQDDSLIYMDPHYCQSFVDVSTDDFPLQSDNTMESEICGCCDNRQIRFHSSNHAEYNLFSVDAAVMPTSYSALQLGEYFQMYVVFLSSRIIAHRQRRCLSARWTQAALSVFTPEVSKTMSESLRSCPRCCSQQLRTNTQRSLLWKVMAEIMNYQRA